MPKSIPVLNLDETREYLVNFGLPFGQRQENIVMLHGKPAIGKSEVIGQIATGLDADVITYFSSTSNEAEICGIPYYNKEKGCIEFIPLENFKFPVGRKVIWFWDEINRGKPEVIQALFSILSSYPHKVGVNVIPDNVCIVLAGNLGEEDNTIVTDFNDSSFYSKLTHIEVRFDRDIFLAHITKRFAGKPQQNFAELVVNFLKDKDDTFCNKLSTSPSVDKAFPVPRTICKFISTFGGKKLTPATLKWGASIVGNEWIQHFSMFVKNVNLGKSTVTPGMFFDPSLPIKDLNSAIKEMDIKDIIDFGNEMMSYIGNISAEKVEALGYDSWKALCDLIVDKMSKDIGKPVLQSIINNNTVRGILDKKGGGNKKEEEKSPAEKAFEAVAKRAIKAIITKGP